MESHMSARNRSRSWLLPLFGCLVGLVGSAWPVLTGALPAPPEKVREPILAGTWYPAAPEALRQMIEGFLRRVPPSAPPGQLVAIIAPHAGYEYSGQVAAHAYKLLEQERIPTVIVIAPSHQARFAGVSVYDRGGFRTPLGVMPLDQDLIAALGKRDPRLRFIPEAHAKEHALEIQVPFLQTVLPDARLVPLVMGDQELTTCQWLGEALTDCIGDKPVLLVASSDLSHFHPSEQARQLDQVVLDRVTAFDPEGLLQNLESRRCEACGGGPMATVMMAARRLGAARSKVLVAANSGDVTGDRSRVVGYMAAAFWRDAGSSERSSPTGPPKVGVDLGLNTEEKALLHKIARDRIEAKLLGTPSPAPDKLPAGLKQMRGAFVTLKKHGELRGCIGHLAADRPLAEVVAEMALAAAFRDPRFSPVTANERKDLEIEISVLTPFRKITDVEEIQVGKHGLLIKRGAASGLLLPQVATDYGWDRTTFLEHTCHKAGLPKRAWKDKDTEIYTFSADVF